jgi:hypothetical protein
MKLELAGLESIKKHQFCSQQKLMIIKEWQNTGKKEQVAKKYGVHPRTLNRWKNILEKSVTGSLLRNDLERNGEIGNDLSRDNLFCNFRIIKDNIRSSKDSNQGLYTKLDYLRLAYFTKGVNSGYTPDELVKLLGVVDESKNSFERTNKSIDFAINTLNSLKKRKTNEDSTDQIMLRRDIAFVTDYLNDLRQIDSKNTPGVMELKDKPSITGETGLPKKERVFDLSDNTKRRPQMDCLTKKFHLFAEDEATSISQQVTNLCIKKRKELTNGGEPGQKQKRSVLKTTIGSIMTALAISAIYMNHFHGAGLGFCKSLVKSFLLICPIGGQ